MFKKCQVVRLSKGNIDHTAKFGYISESKSFHLLPNSKDDWYDLIDNLAIPQHLYILSDDEIKDGYVYTPRLSTRIVEVKKNMSSIGYIVGPAFLYFKQEDKKIIATTDPELIRQGVAKISDEFIKKYCKLNGIDEVMVEYEVYLNQDTNYDDWGNADLKHKLKVTPDNTIIIKDKEIKYSWNKEEVKELIRKYCSGNGINWIWMPKTFDNWIEENL